MKNTRKCMNITGIHRNTDKMQRIQMNYKEILCILFDFVVNIDKIHVFDIIRCKILSQLCEIELFHYGGKKYENYS